MVQALPWVTLLFVTIMASGIFVMIKYMSSYTDPVELLVIRFLPASTAAIIIGVSFYRDAIRKLTPKMWAFFSVRELFAVLGFNLTLMYAAEKLPSGVAALIVSIWPVLTFFLAWVLLGEEITLRKVVGGFLALAGAAAVIIAGARDEAMAANISPAEWIKYSLILLIAPLSASLVTIVTRWYLNRNDGEKLPDSFLFSLLCRMPASLIVPAVYFMLNRNVSIFEHLSTAPPLFWIIAAIFSLYNTLFGFWLYNWVLQKLPAGNVASFSYIQTAIALVIAWLFLGESLTFTKIVAGIAIITGVIVANVERTAPPLIGKNTKEPITPGS